MKLNAKSISLAILLVLAGGCGKPTHDSLAGKMVDKMKELTATLHDITDEASAKAASGKIKSIVTDLQGIKTQADALPKPTSDEDKALQDKYGKQMQEVEANLQGEMMRIGMNPTLMNPIQDSLKGLESIK